MSIDSSSFAVGSDVSLWTTIRGGSMAPCLRSGDVACIEPLLSEPTVGDVVVVGAVGQEPLLVRRIVGRSEHGWLVRGDAEARADEAVTTADLVGRVVRVERGGRVVRFGSGYQGALMATLSRRGWLHRLAVAWQEPGAIPRRAVRVVQRTPQYVRLVRVLRPKICVVDGVPADRADLARALDVRWDPEADAKAGRRRTVLLARVGGPRGRIAGFVWVVENPPADAPRDGYWVAVRVASRYRRMGIAEELFASAIPAARRAGARELQLVTDAGNKPAQGLYRKVGFVQGGSPELLEALDADARAGRRDLVPFRLPLRD